MTSPLAGVRVIEMGQLIAIPYAMKLLADMGAQVIRLESCQRLESYRSDSLYRNDVEGEFWNRAANFYEQNRNKLGITLDLSQPRGLQILRELVAVSDVFAENFTPRVIRNFRLEYEDLRRIRPDIIMVSSTGYGYDGPWANFGATGPATEGASGLAYMTGYRDGGPVMSEIPYTDYTGGEHTVFAVMTALMHRLRTGEGQFIDVSQTQTASATVPEALLDYTVNGRVQPRMGNEDPVMAPHGCYPCRGNDRWCVIAVANDEEWTALCQALERPGWLADPRFDGPLSRRQHGEALDECIAEATRDWDSHRLMDALQSRGVPGGSGAGQQGSVARCPPQGSAISTRSWRIITAPGCLPFPTPAVPGSCPKRPPCLAGLRRSWGNTTAWCYPRFSGTPTPTWRAWKRRGSLATLPPTRWESSARRWTSRCARAGCNGTKATTRKRWHGNTMHPSSRLVVGRQSPSLREALWDLVRSAKNGDPLAPVTVAAPSRYASLSLRHDLGRRGIRQRQVHRAAHAGGAAGSRPPGRKAAAHRGVAEHLAAAGPG